MILHFTPAAIFHDITFDFQEFQRRIFSYSEPKILSFIQNNNDASETIGLHSVTPNIFCKAFCILLL
jgi:hypothetical protein